MTRAISSAAVLYLSAFGWCVPATLRTTAAALSAASAPRITAKAVWNPTQDQLFDIRRKCPEGDPAQHEACFLDAMKSAGASDEATAFVKEFAANGLAYLRAFRDTGRVDIAYIEYLFRANDLDGVLLVNGTPPIIDVDDYKFLSQEDLRKNDDYAAVLQKYPNVGVFPVDRYHTELPVANVTPNGGQEFQVEYLLQDGCHACARIGTLIVAFDFDSSGRFTEVSALGVRPNPKPDDAQPSVRKRPSTLEAKVGDTFTIPLEANHTTGYSWRLAQPLDPAILKQLSEKYGEDNSGRMGAGGVETWTFQAMAKGVTTLVFEYARPFDKNVPPAKTSKFKITIQ
ncbi:MAG TPA: protease inhibitor I42 family protein [Candidatus Acidoferrales bacterium]|jgi:predicted secreted protein